MVDAPRPALILPVIPFSLFRGSPRGSPPPKYRLFLRLWAKCGARANRADERNNREIIRG
jgi:hypothetical protein